MSDFRAFPVDSENFVNLGLTARDYFAAAALTGILSNPNSRADSAEEFAKNSTKAAWVYADKMLDHRREDDEVRK